VGVALAGGRSRRMGRDKTRLRIGDENLTASAVRRLGAVCGEVVVADRGRGIVAGAASVAAGPGRGPAAGVLGAAAVFPGRDLLVLACDLPQVPVALLAALLAETGADWVVPRWERDFEPLCALFRPPAVTALAAQVDDGRYGVRHLAEASGLVVRYLEGEALAACGRPERMFLNLNIPGDLERLTAG
jgi:molybdopterin-guanine dinucleotide biosynthesis protein A